MHVQKWRYARNKISQTYDCGMEYAYLSDEDEQCTPFVFCKEFLIDALWAQINERKTELYGFIYNAEHFPNVSLTSLRVLLRNRFDINFSTRIKECIKFMNHFEKDLKIKTLSELIEVENTPHDDDSPVFLIESSSEWMFAPPLLSLYALMLRIGMAYDGTDLWQFIDKFALNKVKAYQSWRDNYYVGKIYKTLRELRKNRTGRFLPDMKRNWPSNVSVWRMHEESGIVSLSTGEARGICKEWFKESSLV